MASDICCFQRNSVGIFIICQILRQTNKFLCLRNLSNILFVKYILLTLKNTNYNIQLIVNLTQMTIYLLFICYILIVAVSKTKTICF